LDRSFLLA
jgi:2-oxoglutarate dehydrogenase E1 component